MGIRDTLVWHLRHTIRQSRTLVRSRIIDRQYSTIADCIADTSFPRRVLITGFPKTGNTWTRFVLCNYLRLKNDPESEPIPISELNRLQPQILSEPHTLMPRTTDPLIVRTHLPYQRAYDLFDNVVVCIRNPLDTLVSWYYYERDRVVRFPHTPPAFRENFLRNIDAFVLYHLNRWVSFYNATLRRDYHIIQYESMRSDPEANATRLINSVGIRAEEEPIRRAVLMSSYDTVSQKLRETNELHGMADSSTFTGVFTRSGSTGQYQLELRDSTIAEAKSRVDKRASKQLKRSIRYPECG